MAYQYGALLTVISPTGRSVKAQVGEMTPDGPMIYIQSHQMESPANVLRQEGWQIPDIKEVNSPVRPSFSRESLEADAAIIVDALLNPTIDSPLKLPTQLKFHSPPVPKHGAVGREPYILRHQLPHCRHCGSRSHKSAECPYQHNGVAII
jgi:hypothetical protein